MIKLCSGSYNNNKGLKHHCATSNGVFGETRGFFESLKRPLPVPVIYHHLSSTIRGQSFITLGTGAGWNLQNGKKFYTPSIAVQKFSYPVEK